MNKIVDFRLCTLSDRDLIDKVDQQLDKMYETGKIPTRHIPAEPDNDFDLLVGELIVRFWESVKKEGAQNGDRGN